MLSGKNLFQDLNWQQIVLDFFSAVPEAVKKTSINPCDGHFRSAGL